MQDTIIGRTVQKTLDEQETTLNLTVNGEMHSVVATIQRLHQARRHRRVHHHSEGRLATIPSGVRRPHPECVRALLRDDGLFYPVQRGRKDGEDQC